MTDAALTLKPVLRAPAAAERSNIARAAMLSLLGASLQSAAYPPFDAWPLAFVALVPFYFALEGRGRRAGSTLGWLNGFASAIAGFYWLPQVLVRFSNVSFATAATLTCALCAYVALRGALLAWAHTGAVRRGWPPLATFWAAALVSEAVFPALFPWYLGVSLRDRISLVQVADLGGPIAVSALVVSINLLVVATLRRNVRWALAHASLVLAAIAYGKLRITEVDAALRAAPKLTLGLVHPAITTQDKYDVSATLQRHIELSRSLLEEKPPDLILWTETVVAGATDWRAPRYFPGLFTTRLQVPILFGASVASEGKLFNSAYLSQAGGAVCETCRYDKQLLVPVGEYLPGEDVLPQLRAWSTRSGAFSKGPLAHPLTLGAHEIAASICYEDMHPSFINRHARDAGLLVNLSNDGWFTGTDGAKWHAALGQLRAVEQRKYSARAANGGLSRVIDPIGRSVIELAGQEPAVAKVQVAWSRAGTLYGRFGEAPWYALTALLVVANCLRRGTPSGCCSSSGAAGVRAP